jgi:P4 family phage/plasmid primase-like protien
MKSSGKCKKCLCSGNSYSCMCYNINCLKCKTCNANIIKEFESFLNKRYKKTGDNKELTHTCMDENVKGAWSIPKEDYSEFIKLYSKFSRKNVSAYVERSPEIAPYYFDIDFHTKKSNRYYDENFIKETIERINDIVKKTFDVDDNSDVLRSYVFEKFEPTEGKENDYKDGFHILWPELILDVPSRYYVYDKFMEILNKDNYVSSKIPHTNNLEEIFDKSVISSNGVLMYGSAKPGRDPYELTKVYDYSLKKILPNDNYDSDSENDDPEYYKYNGGIMPWDDIINITAMRTYEDEPSLLVKPVTQKIKNKILSIYEDKYCKKTKKVKKNNNFDNLDNIDNLDNLDELDELDNIDNLDNLDGLDNIDFNDLNKNKFIKNKNGITNKDIRLAKELSKIFKKERACSWETWRNVGWALHNVSIKLYDCFNEFSKKAGKNKYDEKSCRKLWATAKDEGFSIGSLRLWAQEDDIEEYDRIIADLNEDIIDKLLSGAHDDVGEYIYSLYANKFVCTDLEKNEWFEFKDNRWHKIAKGTSLFNLISNEIPIKIVSALKDGKKIKGLDIDIDNEIKSNMLKNIKTLLQNLKNVPYKRNIMESCKHKFYDPKFKDKLNSNIYLIGFENGIYSVNPDSLGFRKGVPEDYVSFSVGYNYIFNPDNTYIDNIKSFFKSCLPVEQVRKYVLGFISSCLCGKQKEQKFPFWIGSGGNGKSVTINMIQYAFGEYYSNMSASYLTKRREGSSNATPDLADKVGKRVITFQETEKGETIQVSKLKELCGNDRMAKRELFQEQSYFTPQAKYILATNKLPELNVDQGVARRIRVVEWVMKYVDPDDYDKTNKYHVIKDYNLDEKIQDEKWKQNFMWLLINEYYPIYIKEGLAEPDDVKELSKNYMCNNDKIGQFLKVCTEPTSSKEYSDLFRIYELFKDFYKERFGYKQPNFQSIIEYLRSIGLKVEEKSAAKVYVYGIKMKEEEDDNEEDNSEENKYNNKYNKKII